MKTAAVIPAYNEGSRVSSVARETTRFVDGVIVVDDGSGVDVSQHLGGVEAITVVRHRMNLGKGAALKTGCLAARSLGFEFVVIMDADGQHAPDEIPKLLAPITGGEADVVVGARKARSTMPFVAHLGNRFLSSLAAVLFGVSLSDTQSGFRAFRTRVLDLLLWESAGYSVETEMIVNAGKHGLRIREVPIRTIYHDRYKGTTVVDGVRIFLDMLRWRSR